MMCRTFFQYEIIAPYCKYIEFFLISFFLSRTSGAISSKLCTKYNTLLGEGDSRMIELRALSFYMLKTFWQLLNLFFRNTLQYQLILAQTLLHVSKMNSKFIHKGERGYKVFARFNQKLVQCIIIAFVVSYVKWEIDLNAWPRSTDPNI